MRRLGWWTGLVAGLALMLLAAVQLDWLGAGLGDPIIHGENEDWDWQLTMFEVTRRSVLDHHQLPGWSPYTQGGVPLLANPEFPLFYPPFLLVLVFGTTVGTKLLILLHQLLLVFSCWLAGRQLGLSPLAAHGAALLALCSAFTPGFIAAGHVMYLPLGWLPLAWVAQQRGRWALAGLCLALPMLAGGHYLLLYGALWLGVDACLRGLRQDRLRWLGAALFANALLLGVTPAAWPVGVALLVGVLVQRPQGLRATLPPMLMAGALAAALLGLKFFTAPPLFDRAERLAAQVSLSIADPYTLLSALEVMAGEVPRPSGHEGQNVFFSRIPVVMGLVGLGLACWRRPLLGCLGLIWWCLGWGGATPVNLLEGLHRLPGFDLIRVVERYSLVWTLFLGWGMGHLLDTLWHRLGAWSLPAWAPVAWVVWLAAPQAAQLQRMGASAQTQLAAGDFVQVRDELSNFQAVQANRGKLDCWTTAWLDDPSPQLRAVGEPEYIGEAWLLETGEALELEHSPNRLRVRLPTQGTVVVNQNAFDGWRTEQGPADQWRGLLSASGDAGWMELRYSPPGLIPGALATLLGLLTLLAGSLWPWPLRRGES